MKKNKNLRPLWILLSVMAGVAVLLVLLASVGVFRSYRYDDSGYAVGGGTVEGTVRALEIDWLSGPIHLEITEDDSNLSVSEYAGETLRERDRLRWKLEADGKLTVKACASADYLPRNPATKLLVIRVPAAMAGALESLTVRVRSGAAQVELAVLPEETGIRADQGGEIRLTLPEAAGYTLRCEDLKTPPVGSVWNEQDGTYVRGDGHAKLTVRGSGRQQLRIESKKSAE